MIYYVIHYISWEFLIFKKLGNPQNPCTALGLHMGVKEGCPEASQNTATCNGYSLSTAQLQSTVFSFHTHMPWLINWLIKITHTQIIMKFENWTKFNFFWAKLMCTLLSRLTTHTNNHCLFHYHHLFPLLFFFFFLFFTFTLFSSFHFTLIQYWFSALFKYSPLFQSIIYTI